MGSGTPKIFSLRPVESPPIREILDREVISTPEREGFIAEAAVEDAIGCTVFFRHC